MSIFMKVDGINGETSDSNYKNWLDIESISWNTNRKITSNTSTQDDRESANAEISSLFVKKYMDKATPQIFLETCCGTGKTITIRLTKTGKGKGSDQYMEYVLSNALFAYYQIEAESQTVDRPIEKMEISFTKLEVKYTPYDENGIQLANLATSFDTATNLVIVRLKLWVLNLNL